MPAFLMLVLAAAMPSAPSARAGDEPVLTSDLLRIRTVADIDVSADGTRAVYAVRSIARTSPAGKDDHGKPTPPEYKYQSHLFLIALDRNDAEPVQLTFGRRNDHAPRFSPDGSSVVFVRSRPKSAAGGDEDEDDERPQVWLLPLTGGEARQITDFEHGASGPIFAPDGARVLVSSRIPADELAGEPEWPIERPRRAWNDAKAQENDPELSPRPDGTREEIRAWLEENAWREAPSVITRLDFLDERSLQKPYRFRHLFLVELEATGDEPVPADDARQVTGGFFDHTDPAFLPDGRGIVYIAKKVTDRHPDRVRETSVWMVDSDGSNDRLLLARDGWTFDAPKPNMNGSIIAFLARETDEPTFRQQRIGIFPTGGEAAEPVWLTDTLDTSARSFEWMLAREAIVFNAALNGSVPLYTISRAMLEPNVLVDGPRGVIAFDVGGGAIVYGETSPANPCVLKAITPRGERVLDDLNPWVEAKTLSIPEESWIDRPDGTRVQSWIMPPTNLLEGEQYPLVLAIHGGPAAMWGPGEATMWHELQLLCSWGYGVVFCNPRGSGGYGYDFQKANYQNWGDGPGGDVLAAVDRALRLPWVDPDRLVVTGGSYAGYLTAWIVGHDHRFKAAVAQRGVYDLITFFGEGNAWRLVEYAFGGQPWDSNIRSILQRESPFTHVLRIRTPLLILHSSRDLRTGVSQSEMLYRALKVLEKPVEYVRYPGAGHDLSRTGDPYLRMDRLNRIIEFFERHIENPRPAPVIPEAVIEEDEVETESEDDADR